MTGLVISPNCEGLGLVSSALPSARAGAHVRTTGVRDAAGAGALPSSYLNLVDINPGSCPLMARRDALEQLRRR